MITSTFLSSANIIPILAIVFACSAFPAEIKCPSYQDKHPLANVRVFNGPPEEKADLVPDQSTGRGDHASASWDIGYIFATGRKPFVVCQYSGLGDAKNVTIKVEKKAERCIFRRRPRGQPAELTCN